MIPDNLIAKDLQHIWHPCSLMKDFERYPPLVVHAAKGSYLETNEGQLIDGISSWWCKSLGHQHPAIMTAIRDQLDRFEHVMPANTTHPSIVALSEALTEITHKQHVYFASDGASAIEVAIKLAIQATAIKGQPERHHIIALRHAYHGETLGALSVSDLALFKHAWSQFGFPCHFLDPIPYVCDIHDPLWKCADLHWASIVKQLDAVKHLSCAIIVEPIVQGANGLWPYSADFLSKLAVYAQQHDIYLIADEIMTGLGRTGEWLACDHAGIQADMVCLSKGLTSGSVPLSCVLIDHSIYELYYGQTNPQHYFLHSHTYSGNPLAVAAALATIETMRTEDINQQARELGSYMRRCFSEVITRSGQFTPLRGIGAMVAADFIGDCDANFSLCFAQEAQKRGALLRTIGQTLYWFPPLNTAAATIDKLADITDQAIQAVLQEQARCTV